MGATVLVSGAAIWGGWAVTHQDRQVSPLDGRVSVKVPLSWHDRVDVPFPGGTDPRDGVRIESGRQAVSIAYSEDVRQPQDLLSQVRPARCASRSTSTVRVGRWNGLSDRLTSCEGGVDISEVALTSAGGEGSASSPGWTVWVEVRSFGGDPDLSAVLASLEIDPA